MKNKWVSVWANSMSCDEFKPVCYSKNMTLRYVILPLLTGNKVRLRFSNTYGDESVKLDRVTIAKAGENGSASCFVNITFNGCKDVVLPVGKFVFSDEIDFLVKRNEKLAVSIYFAGITDMHSSVSTAGPLSENYFITGDYSDAENLPIEISDKNTRYYFLDEIDVLTDDSNSAAVVFGDSISAQSWPEWLALRVSESNHDKISIIRRAISGGRVLRQYDCLKYKKYGMSGISRFENDVITSGVDRVFVLHGINDIIHPDGVDPFRPLSHLPTPEQMIEGYRKYIDIAHRHGIKIYIATILPFENWRSYTPEKNEIRLAVNHWIRKSREADGYIEFDLFMQYPNQPSRLLEQYDSGDHLHPNLEGGKFLASLVPDRFLD